MILEIILTISVVLLVAFGIAILTTIVAIISAKIDEKKIYKNKEK